jgi:hypothetical protein
MTIVASAAHVNREIRRLRTELTELEERQAKLGSDLGTRTARRRVSRWGKAKPRSIQENAFDHLERTASSSIG